MQNPSNILKIKPQISRESILKKGWKREINQSKESITHARRSELKQTKLEKLEELTDIGFFSEQILLDEVLNLIAESSTINDHATFKEVSKKLNGIINNSDIEKAKEYDETYQLGLINLVALSFLILTSQTASKPAVDEIEKRSRVDFSKTPQQAAVQLEELKDNYKQIQQASSDFLNSLLNLPFLDAIVAPLSLFIATILGYLLFLQGSSMSLENYLHVSSIVLFCLLCSLYFGKSVYDGYVLFRATATGILHNLKLKLALP